MSELAAVQGHVCQGMLASFRKRKSSNALQVCCSLLSLCSLSLTLWEGLMATPAQGTRQRPCLCFGCACDRLNRSFCCCECTG